LASGVTPETFPMTVTVSPARVGRMNRTSATPVWS
jgi:hypothetical protein